MTPMTGTPAGFRDALAAHFSLDELDLLCADIGINPDSAPRRDTIEGRAQAVIEYVRHRGLLPALVAACQRARPAVAVDWAHFASLADASPTPAIADGVRALTAMADTPGAREALCAFKTDFEYAGDQIALLRDFKTLHERLQEVAVRYAPLEADSHRVVGDPSAWATVVPTAAETGDILREIAALAARPALGVSNVLWLTHLAQAREGLAAAVEGSDVARLRDACADLKRALARGPSQVNTRMVAVVDNLLGSRMITRMQGARGALVAAAVSPAALADFDAALLALETLRARLLALRDEHNGWQEVDNALSRIQDTLAVDSTELDQTWPEVHALSETLLATSTEPWATRLRELGAAITQALAARDLALARRVFASFVSAAGRRFRQVDDLLVQISRELQTVGAALEELVAAIR